MKLRLSVYVGIIVTCIPLVTAGGCRKVLKSDLVGDYVFDYPYGRETLTLSEDGRYVQNFSPKDKALQAAGATGKWDTDGEDLVLQDALVVDDFSGDLSSSYAERKHGLSRLPIESSFGAIRLRISTDNEYSFRKQKR